MLQVVLAEPRVAAEPDRIERQPRPQPVPRLVNPIVPERAQPSGRESQTYCRDRQSRMEQPQVAAKPRGEGRPEQRDALRRGAAFWRSHAPEVLSHASPHDRVEGVVVQKPRGGGRRRPGSRAGRRRAHDRGVDLELAYDGTRPFVVGVVGLEHERRVLEAIARHPEHVGTAGVHLQEVFEVVPLAAYAPVPVGGGVECHAGRETSSRWIRRRRDGDGGGSRGIKGGVMVELGYDILLALPPLGGGNNPTP